MAATRESEGEASRHPAEDRPDSLEAEIRLRAYYRYLERDEEPGDAVEDWLEAESGVLGRRATGVDAAERFGRDETVPTSNTSVPPPER